MKTEIKKKTESTAAVKKPTFKHKVAILLGSKNDESYTSEAMDYFKYFSINAELHILSAHRNPDDVANFAKNARKNGFSLLIGSAGMAAHLAGALAAHSDLPVIGVPLPGGLADGLDALLSTAQMPKGVPVATFAVGKSGMINAAVFSAQVLSLNDAAMAKKMREFKSNGCKI